VNVIQQFLVNSRGVTTGEQGGHIAHGAKSLGSPKSPKNVASAFFIRVHLLPKDLRFERGGARLASYPGAT